MLAPWDVLGHQHLRAWVLDTILVTPPPPGSIQHRGTAAVWCDAVQAKVRSGQAVRAPGTLSAAKGQDK